MNAIAQLPNWHRWVIGILGVILVIATGIVSTPSVVPPDLHALVVYSPLVILIVGGALANLPRLALPTGAGAPPIESPPAKGVTWYPVHPASPAVADPAPVPLAPVVLVDGHVLPPQG